ncbi:plastocyanin/azurin family copper-binding protein [Salinarchaeum sp. Harcht-Bsk1]|uniref:cupredoxin domain-containing protein n=1 Tax=Salinarchaeum sp. Harcht-Bsk1 TaxID=1333523 RepID=UPI0006777558|nr:plastocyanin/azurin family copper-binding protein [Salinarchaeum sp. Harcht-Bsk1]
MERRAYLTGMGSAAVVGLAGCMGFLEEDYDVGMSPTDFEPRDLTVDVGTTVVWKNTSSRGHTITAYENAIPAEASFFATGEFESEQAAREAWNTGRENDGIIGPSETYEHTFEVPGRYDYFCIPHESESMAGAIVVEE